MRYGLVRWDGHSGALGRVKLKVLPWPAELSSQMRPPWASRMPATMLNPRPEPPAELLLGEAGAGVDDVDADLVAVRPCGEGDRARRGGVGDGVLHQVVQDPLHPWGVHQHAGQSVGVPRQPYLPILCLKLCAPGRRFPVPGDSSSRFAHAMPSEMWRNNVRIATDTTFSRGDRCAGQLVKSCTNSPCIRTVRTFRVFDRRTSNVGGSPA